MIIKWDNFKGLFGNLCEWRRYNKRKYKRKVIVFCVNYIYCIDKERLMVKSWGRYKI